MTTTSNTTKSVFVLDDDDFSQDVMAGMLSELGITEVTTALNGKNALQQLANMSTPPDLLICDILMPDMDGMDFLMELGKLHYKGKVMLVSGIAEDVLKIAEDVVRADGIQLLGAFIKPIKLEDLRRAITQDSP
ncbi:response regulator [Undibacterium fentianense]|uniref:Response regulator n=1 Tax=Undibacterium fentianense TaxID=2828728 RepID=A0A941E1J1_9BURK|nr:response regulator [Undibacterium fentianense]MBR7799671.1 response regulator [Undibacterium fentianense]